MANPEYGEGNNLKIEEQPEKIPVTDPSSLQEILGRILNENEAGRIAIVGEVAKKTVEEITKEK